MGRPDQNPIVITHFSHPHPLHLTAAIYPPSVTAASARCAGCALPASSSTSYSCSPCGFFLHYTCANLRPLLLHPCDPMHGLALLPSPPYSDSLYTCDACGRPGSGFVYHCATCKLDLHTLCARAAMAVSCPAHPQHALTLTFASPYGEAKGFVCDVCGRSGAPQEWLYRCATCAFDVHLVCDSEVVEAPAVHVSYSGSLKGEGEGAATGITRGGQEEFAQNVAQGIAEGLVQGIIGGGGGGGNEFEVEMSV